MDGPPNPRWNPPIHRRSPSRYLVAKLEQPWRVGIITLLANVDRKLVHIERCD